jgi:hypothetical protein
MPLLLVAKVESGGCTRLSVDQWYGLRFRFATAYEINFGRGATPGRSRGVPPGCSLRVCPCVIWSRPQSSRPGHEVCVGPCRTGLNGAQLQPCVQPLEHVPLRWGRCYTAATSWEPCDSICVNQCLGGWPPRIEPRTQGFSDHCGGCSWTVNGSRKLDLAHFPKSANDHGDNGNHLATSHPASSPGSRATLQYQSGVSTSTPQTAYNSHILNMAGPWRGLGADNGLRARPEPPLHGVPVPGDYAVASGGGRPG